MTQIQVKVKRGEPVEKALKRLKKILDKEGTMKELRAEVGALRQDVKHLIELLEHQRAESEPEDGAAGLE